METAQKREGLVCVCAECGRVIQAYGRPAPAGAPALSHGICPACAEKLYGRYFSSNGSGSTTSGGAPSAGT